MEHQFRIQQDTYVDIFFRAQCTYWRSHIASKSVADTHSHTPYVSSQFIPHCVLNHFLPFLRHSARRPASDNSADLFISEKMMFKYKKWKFREKKLLPRFFIVGCCRSGLVWLSGCTDISFRSNNNSLRWTRFCCSYFWILSSLLHFSGTLIMINKISCEYAHITTVKAAYLCCVCFLLFSGDPFFHFTALNVDGYYFD